MSVRADDSWDAVLCLVMPCCDVLVCVSYRHTVNRPTCRWRQTLKETHERLDMKDERGDEIKNEAGEETNERRNE